MAERGSGAAPPQCAYGERTDAGASSVAQLRQRRIEATSTPSTRGSTALARTVVCGKPAWVLPLMLIAFLCQPPPVLGGLNCCLPPYAPSSCEGGGTYENRSTHCYPSSGQDHSCQDCIFADGYYGTASECTRCCGFSEDTCSSGMSSWLVGVIVMASVCCCCTVIFAMTEKTRRARGMTMAEAYTIRAPMAVLASAYRGRGRAANDHLEEKDFPVAEKALENTIAIPVVPTEHMTLHGSSIPIGETRSPFVDLQGDEENVDLGGTTTAMVPGDDDLARPSGGDGDADGLAVAVPDYGEVSASEGGNATTRSSSSRRSRSRRPGNSRGRPLNEPLVDDPES